VAAFRNRRARDTEIGGSAGMLDMLGFSQAMDKQMIAPTDATQNAGHQTLEPNLNAYIYRKY